MSHGPLLDLRRARDVRGLQSGREWAGGPRRVLHDGGPSKTCAVSKRRLAYGECWCPKREEQSARVSGELPANNLAHFPESGAYHSRRSHNRSDYNLRKTGPAAMVLLLLITRTSATDRSRTLAPLPVQMHRQLFSQRHRRDRPCHSARRKNVPRPQRKRKQPLLEVNIGCHDSGRCACHSVKR